MITHPHIAHELGRERGADRRSVAARLRRIREARRARTARMDASPEQVVIRPAVAGDFLEIVVLAERQSKPMPGGRPLVAVRDGRLEAVLDTESGEVLADALPSLGLYARLVDAWCADGRAVASPTLAPCAA